MDFAVCCKKREQRERREKKAKKKGTLVRADDTLKGACLVPPSPAR